VSKINWQTERDRLAKIASQVHAIRHRIWNSDESIGWDSALAQIGTDIDRLADQITAQKLNGKY